MSNPLQETLKLDKASIVDLSFYPSEEGLNCVLVCKAPLSIEASKVLECQDRFFTINDTPFSDYQGRITLEHIAKSCKVTVGDAPGILTFLPDKVWKFNIGLEKDSRPSVAFRMHFDSRWRTELVDFCNGLNKGEINMEIIALQATLWIKEPAPSGEGTRVDVTGKPDDRQMKLGEESVTACRHCDGGIAVNEEGIHENGEPCEHRRAAAASVVEIRPGTVASAREVAGGTHQKKRRGAKGQAEEPVREFEQI